MAEDKIINNKGGEEKPTKKAKAVKLLSAKKLPSMFKKQYTEKDFNKKILKKIYIEADAEFIKQHFASAKDKKGRDVLAVELNSTLPKNDVIKFKLLAKQIKAQKGGIKFVPLFAVVIFIAATGICVTLFKNIVLKKAMVSAMQGIFNAKTDIAKVDLQIFKSSLEITGLEQANKNSPMKNLFQIDKIALDFNLTELLKGKFDAENMEVSGVAIDTDRKTSGELPAKKVKAKKEKPAESKIDSDKKSLADSAAVKLKAMFADYNPEKLLSGIQSELKSPDTAKRISADVQAKAEKWQAVPKDIENSVKDLSANVETLTKTDWSKVNDPVKLKDSLEAVKKAMDSGKALSEKIKSSTNGLAEDSAAVKDYAKDLQAAIKSDTALIDEKVKTLKNTFSPTGLKQIMNDAVQSMMYEILGKYAPYAIKAVNAAQSAKSSSQGNTKKKENAKAKKKSAKTKPAQRQKGRNVYYKADKVTKFLIEKAVASGYEYNTNDLLFKGTAEEISSNQDVRGKPAKLSAEFKIGKHANFANAVIDTRTSSSAPLISADYKGSGYPINVNTGAFNLNSFSDITANLSADTDGSFAAGGTISMSVSEMSGMDFEPAKICEIYKKALSNIRALDIGFRIEYSADGSINVNILNPEKLSAQLVTPITAAMTDELDLIAKDAQKKAAELLSEKTGIAADSLTKFTSIEDAVKLQQKQAAALEAQLQSKKSEIERQIKKAAGDSAAGALEKAGVPSGAADTLKKLKLF